MKIYYTNTLNEIIDFAIFNVKNSEYAKRSLKIYTAIMPIACFLLCIMLDWNNFENILLDNILLIGNLILIVIGLLWSIYYPKYYYWRIRNIFTKQASDTKNKNKIKLQSIELNKEKIIQSLGEEIYIFPWESLDKVIVKGNYIYISVGISNAIIPLSAFNSVEEKNLFFELIKEHVNIQEDV